jgi:hypothetical protein
MGVFEFARISHASIGCLNVTQKLHLLLHAFKVDQKNTLELPKKILHTKAYCGCHVRKY